MTDFASMAPGLSTIPQATSGVESSPDYSELIQHIATPIDPKLVQAATTPIPGSHASTVPSNFLKPIEDFKSAPINHNPVVGRKQGRLQGIGNAIIGATNALGAVVTAEQQTKQNQVKDAATKVIISQQAIDEAKQAHDAAAAAGNTEAAAASQKIIDQNTKTRDGIFSDPKLRKALTKGFDISYTDPASNKTDEHEAVMAAMKAAKTLQEKKEIQKQVQEKQNTAAGQAAGTAYAAQQPRTMIPNAVAQQQLAIAQANQKANIEATKALVPLMAATVRANSSLTMEQRKEENAQTIEFMRTQSAWDRTQAQIGARQDLAKTQFGYKLTEIAAEGTKDLAVFKSKLALKSSDPDSQVKAYTEFQTKTAETQTKIQEHIADLQVQRDKEAEVKPYNTAAVSNLDQQILLAKQAQQSFKEASDSIQSWYNRSAGVQGGGTLSDTSSGSGIDNASSYLTDSAADPDSEESEP
jgi:hypothetical protein